jgi:hypothetical protein
MKPYIFIILSDPTENFPIVDKWRLSQQHLKHSFGIEKALRINSKYEITRRSRDQVLVLL